MSYFQAVVLGLLQGVTELVPISSLGHTVLLPDWFGWHDLVRAQSADESFFLAFVVALHVATALALLVHYRETWARIVKGLLALQGGDMEIASRVGVGTRVTIRLPVNAEMPTYDQEAPKLERILPAAQTPNAAMARMKKRA